MAELKQIKVSCKSSVPQTAGSITISIESGCAVEVRAVGAGAVNQMYKAIATARGTLASKGKDVLIRPGFTEVTENGESKTVMLAKLVVM